MSVPTHIQTVGVLGAGAWGTALANVAARAGRDVILWGRNAEAMRRIGERRESPRLSGIRLDDAVRVTADLKTAATVDAILLVVPAQAVRETASTLHDIMPSGTPVVACAKGIERGTQRFMTEVIAEGAQTALPAILSGPSFASDVARGLPTAVTPAAREPGLAEVLARALGSSSFRPHHSTAARGVEIGGAAVKVLGTAARSGTRPGPAPTAPAAMTTRGFAELFRFGRAFGARGETLTGLAGLGDLVLTCSSPQSRNYALGLALGRGEAVHGGVLAEGALTAPVLVALARAHEIEMPIAQAVAAVLDQSLSVDQAIEALMTRPFRAED